MKTIGLIGGMSWESTIPFYRILNQTIAQRLGGFHSARVLLHSVDFDDYEQLQRSGDWQAAGALMAEVARGLEAGGADLLVICSNTMHKVVGDVEAAIRIPVLHVVDPTAAAITQAGHSVVGLLGTRFTMEQAFYRDRLEAKGLQVLIPEADDRDTVHRVIYQELCQGVISDVSRQAYRGIMARLVAQGATAIILGCTEIALLVGADDASVPLFDTTWLHATATAEEALSA